MNIKTSYLAIPLIFVGLLVQAQSAKPPTPAGNKTTTANFERQMRMTSSRAAAHPLIHEGLLTNPQEGLVIGNGDLGASVQIFSHELKINLPKISRNGEPVPFAYEGRDLIFDTEVGAVYQVE